MSQIWEVCKPRYGTLFAHALGMTNGTIDRIRRADVNAGIDHLEPLAQALGVEPWELLVPPERREALHALYQALKASTPATPEVRC